MKFRFLADAVVVAHFGFVLFVLLGGLLALRWPKAAWLHLPAAAWGALVEFTGWICPLTPLEKGLREQAGETAVTGGFVEHYVIPLLYPAALTQPAQWLLGTIVVVLNAVVYAVVLRRRRR